VAAGFSRQVVQRNSCYGQQNSLLISLQCLPNVIYWSLTLRREHRRQSESKWRENIRT